MVFYENSPQALAAEAERKHREMSSRFHADIRSGLVPRLPGIENTRLAEPTKTHNGWRAGILTHEDRCVGAALLTPSGKIEYALHGIAPGSEQET